MKTITLDEDAYNRLKAWKRGGRESFSSVVKRVVPEPGSLASFVGFVESRATSSLPNNDLLEESINDRSPVKEDPWT
jgi:predicted CopG family antitoxin